jgi:plasmid stabilization system protein ParE
VTDLRVAPRAEGHIRRISAWWREHRPAAPRLFALEVADALELLATMPTLGVYYAQRRGQTIRRLLLPRSRYHIYFTYDEAADVLEVRAVWHATRGRGPSL